jgi:L-ornithine N5-oxygenase
MAPSAISTPTDELSSFHSNGVSSLNGQLSNMHLNGHAPLSTSPSETLDLLCIGFGPASLAIAIALHDTLPKTSPSPSVLFLENQPQFAWHAGMQLPGAKMQISFLKDLATPRDPRSNFTFINYLFSQGRLNQFINLSTFLPSRAEYEDYLSWCAGHFEREGKVAYGMDVCGVKVGTTNAEGRATSWEVTARSTSTGELVTRRAKHVVVAVGGRPVIPQIMQGLKHVAHSSQFANTITRIEEAAKDSIRPLRFAVVGSGQSAAEIFNDLWERFPDSNVRLIIKGASLRPSDDSPFVNEIFDPDRVDGIYSQDPTLRASALALDRGTNYGVVRLTLLEHLYEKLYMQRLRSSNPSQWRANILANRQVLSASQSKDSSVKLRLGEVQQNATGVQGSGEEEELEVDYVFTATGYKRNAHEEILSELTKLLPSDSNSKFGVKRDYSVVFDGTKVDESAGVWLQGCNEGTHGLSDTLLSILAIRGGELVNSIFGNGNDSEAPSTGSSSPA